MASDVMVVVVGVVVRVAVMVSCWVTTTGMAVMIVTPVSSVVIVGEIAVIVAVVVSVASLIMRISRVRIGLASVISNSCSTVGLSVICGRRGM